MAEIEVNGKTAHYTTGGRAWEQGLPQVVMLHGAGLTQAVWVMQARALAHHGWNVAAPDLPGHGASADVPAIATLEDYAGWVGEFMAALGVERAVICGHSMGAAIALTLAAGSPQKVVALVLAAAAAELAVNAALLADTLADTPRAIGMITAFSYDPGHHLGGSATPGMWLMGGSAALLGACPPATLHRDYDAANRWQGEGYLPRVTCPALVLAGGGDRMVPARQGQALAEALPRATFQLFPGAGHDLMAEAPRPMLKAMRAFLQPLAQPGA